MKNNIFFLFLLSFIFIIPGINANIPDGTTGIFYNYTHPSGVLGNPHLVWNDGTASSGIVMNGTTIQTLTSAHIIDYTKTGEVTPIGLQNVFSENEGYTGFIHTNENTLNTDQSFSYFTWVKRSTPLTQYTASYYMNPLLSNFANKTGDLLLDFQMFSSTYHNLEQAGSPTISFNMGFIGENNNISCSTPYSNYTLLRDTTKYHLIGFVYNYSNILSGDLVKIYYDGKVIENCSVHSLSGTASAGELKPLIIGATTGPIGIPRPSDIIYYPANQKLSNTGLYTYALEDSQILTLNSTSYFNGTQPSLFNPFEDIYDVTNASITLNLSDYFSTNYDDIQVHYHDNFINNTNIPVTLNKPTANTTPTSFNYSVNMTLWSDGFYQYLKMEKGIKNLATQVYVTASNSYGNTSDFFALYYYTNSSFINGTLINGTIFTGGTVFGNIVQSFSNIFPDSSGLSSSVKFTYVIITLLMITITILVVGKEHMGTALILALILDSLLFLYFVFIGYVPFGIILIIALIGVIASYLKFKSGGN
jgi:hypothetical protein